MDIGLHRYTLESRKYCVFSIYVCFKQKRIGLRIKKKMLLLFGTRISCIWVAVALPLHVLSENTYTYYYMFVVVFDLLQYNFTL